MEQSKSIVNKSSGLKHFSYLQNLFALCPNMPWGDEVISSAETNEKGWVSLQGFLAQWT